MQKRRALKLSIPPQTETPPTVCDGTLHGFDVWSRSLPVSDPLQTAKAIHDALAELSAFRVDFATRFAILELLRPFVHAANMAITRRRREASLTLDARGRREAALAQRVQYQLAVGYKIVIVTALRDGTRLEPDTADGTDTRLVVIAIHRALTELLHTLMRSLQFYTRPPANLWAQFHSLYALAEVKRVHDEPVRDDEQVLRQLTQPTDVYERALLLASAQPNQLRQADLATLFRALEVWTALVSVVPTTALPAPVVVVDLTGDGPPRPPRLAEATDIADQRSPDTRRLVAKFDEYLTGDPDVPHAELLMVDLEHRELVRHCARVWGEPTDRAYERTPATGHVEVCTGLVHAHFHAGGGRSLLRQMQSERLEEEEETEEEDDYIDPFAGAVDVDGVRAGPRIDLTPQRFISTEVEETEADHLLTRLRLADVSPIGFGLICEGEAPEDVSTGQLLALREADDPDWRITMVRWVTNAREGARIGVETLAQQAFSGGARLLSSRGRDLDFNRALLLPGVEALDQPPFLITAPGVFEEGSKIAFTQGGQETKLIVEARVAEVPGFEQFRVRELVTAASASPDTGIEVEVMSEEEERAALAAFGVLDQSDADGRS
jgi:hypothetical protein